MIKPLICIGYCLLSIAVISIALFAFSGCSNLPKTPYTVEEETIWGDGSISEPGEQPYVTKDGKGTAHKVDPKTGEENKPATIYDESEIKKGIDKGKEVAGKAPAPFGEIATGVVGTVGLVILAWVAMKNRKKIKKLGGKSTKDNEKV